MTILSIKFKLEPQTLEHISKSTRLTKEELYTLTTKEAYNKMVERGAIKKPNPIKVFFKKIYKNLGERFGLLEKQHNIYTHID